MGEDAYEPLAPPPAVPIAENAQPEATEDNNQYDAIMLPPVPPDKLDRKHLPQSPADEESVTDLNSHSKKSKKNIKEDDKAKPARKIVASGEKIKPGVHIRRKKVASKKRKQRTTCNCACLSVSAVCVAFFFCGTVLSVAAIVVKFDYAKAFA
ncbi:hypothetical protein AAVH_02551 [Aphelenchoides avenae]|nr:hypothetical protein AAVH_02551 [Aphelenchus avenae]